MDLTGMTDGELEALASAVAREQQARLIPWQMDSLNRMYLEASGVEPGTPWRQPEGAHDAYPKGWLVTHAGRRWGSLVAGNVWEPGVSGWAEVAEWPVWVQPTGAHDAYPKGSQVTHKGARWISDLDANVWEPGVGGWTEVA